MSLIQEALRRQAAETPDGSAPVPEPTPVPSGTPPSPAAPSQPLPPQRSRTTSPLWALIPLLLLLIAGGTLWMLWLRPKAPQSVDAPTTAPLAAMPERLEVPLETTDVTKDPASADPTDAERSVATDTQSQPGAYPEIRDAPDAQPPMPVPGSVAQLPPEGAPILVAPSQEPAAPADPEVALSPTTADDSPHLTDTPPTPAPPLVTAAPSLPRPPVDPAHRPDVADPPTDRRPEPAADPPKIAAPSAPWPDLVISGILAGASGRRGAVVVNNRIVGVGETHEGAKLIAVGPQQAEFEFAGEQRTFRMSTTRNR